MRGRTQEAFRLALRAERKIVRVVGVFFSEPVSMMQKLNAVRSPGMVASSTSAAEQNGGSRQEI
jgi:hypothetical protein